MTALLDVRMQGHRTDAGQHTEVCPCIRESALHPYAAQDASVESVCATAVSGNRTTNVVEPGSDATEISP